MTGVDFSEIQLIQSFVDVADKDEDDIEKRPIEIGSPHEVTRDELEQYEYEEEEKDDEEDVKQLMAEALQGLQPRAEWYKRLGLGGMSREIDFVMKNLFLPKFNPELYERLTRLNVINGGMLLYGPPGSGKTFLCEKTAAVW